MKIETVAEESGLRVSFHGNIDLGSVEEVRKQLDSVADTNSNRYILDFNDVGYVDSAGLGALVTFYKRQSTKDIIFENLNERVKKLFQITRLDSVFQIR